MPPVYNRIDIKGYRVLGSFPSIPALTVIGRERALLRNQLSLSQGPARPSSSRFSATTARLGASFWRNYPNNTCHSTDLTPITNVDASPHRQTQPLAFKAKRSCRIIWVRPNDLGFSRRGVAATPGKPEATYFVRCDRSGTMQGAAEKARRRKTPRPCPPRARKKGEPHHIA